jgi:hypothetical protein
VFQVQSTVLYVFWVIAIIAFVFEVWALIDAVRTPAPAFEAASKQTKQIWLIILGIANVIGLGGAVNLLTILSLLPIAAFIAAAIYLADVRPAVKQFRDRRGGSSNTGPYGPW